MIDYLTDHRWVHVRHFNLLREQISSIEHLTLRYITIDIEHSYAPTSYLRSLDTQKTSNHSIHINRFDVLRNGLTLNAVHKLCSLFLRVEQINFHVDTMPYLLEFLTNMLMTVSTLVIEHWIIGLRANISYYVTNECLKNFARLYRICYKFDETRTAIVWI
ncbi:unnamed protein product [Rotaria sp. Silwood2]|nr:unnamed protein product [Rotaria sp. Silwood2]CAF4475489.1 unnamed protein product [Rotaria sp. Silwood2]